MVAGNSFSAGQVEPPSQLRVADITSRSVRLSWSVDADAVHLAYTIHVRALDGGEFSVDVMGRMEVGWTSLKYVRSCKGVAS